MVESPSDPNRVFFGAWVTVEDATGDEKTYRIVGPDESDVDQGWISMDAPMAKGLMGKTIGDDVMILRPKGASVYSIVAVRYHA